MRSALKVALGFPFMFLRKARFKRFYKRNLVKTQIIYRNSEQATALNGAYDNFIVGSDQVWNPENNGNDTAFLLDFVQDDSKKISYSSSFGVSMIPDELVADYSAYLNKFEHLAVRENAGIQLIKSLCGRDATLVLDPVFLLTREQWLKFTKPISERFVFSYTNRAGQFEEFIRQTRYDMTDIRHYKLARQTGVADFIAPEVRVKYTMSPESFLSVINSAELIVSASFHCIALSIIFNKNFVVILTGDKGKDERLLSLLSNLGLENRIFSGSMTLEDVKRQPDYAEVNKKLKDLVKKSTDYLKSSLQLQD